MVGHVSLHASGLSPIAIFRDIYNFLERMGAVALCFYVVFYLVFAIFSQQANSRELDSTDGVLSFLSRQLCGSGWLNRAEVHLCQSHLVHRQQLC
jgi:hypothetical protein